jgi:hypothetical protein
LVGHILSTSFYNETPHRGGGNAAPVNFANFLGVWVLFLTPFFTWTCFYLSPRPGRETATDKDAKERRGLMVLRVLLALDALCFILFFGGAVAMSAGLGVHSCANTSYTTSNKITRSSPNSKVRCREAQASTAFLWFEFIVFGASLAMEGRAVYYKVFPGKLNAKAVQRPAIQVDDVGGDAEEGVDVEMRRAGRPTDFYGIERQDGREDGFGDKYAAAGPPKDEYAGSSIFGRREDEAAAETEQPVPELESKRESPFAALGRRFSAALRGVKKRAQKDEW